MAAVKLLVFSCCLPHSHTCTTHRRLSDYDLTSIGILDANHRRAIVNKASSSSGADDDFNNVLGDLSSVIKDLEFFSVVRTRG